MRISKHAGTIRVTTVLHVEDFTKRNLMKINEKKSKVIMFKKSRKYDFPPKYSFRDNQLLEVLEETKLLGIQLSSDLCWFSNTAAIFSKAMCKMWLLRGMKFKKLSLKPSWIITSKKSDP